MTSEHSIGRLIVTEPAVQIAVVLIGVLLLWYEVRRTRKRLNTESASTGYPRALDLCNSQIASRAKIIISAAIIIQLGLCMLMASSNVVSAKVAFALLAILIFTTLIPAIVYFILRGVPAPLLRWLLSERP